MRPPASPIGIVPAPATLLLVTLLLVTLLLAASPLAAEPPEAKPQAGNIAREYDGYLETRTEHFLFVYEPHDRAVVQDLVSYADEVYEEVTSFLGSRPDRIPVVINGRTSYANGYFTGEPPGHISLTVTRPAEPWLGVRHDSWIRMVFVHEVVHYVHLAYDRGFFAALAAVFGDEARLGHLPFMPLWNIEGIAIELESELTDGGRQNSPFFELYYRALILEDSLFTLGQSGYSSHLPPPGRYYVAGAMLVGYFLDEYGEETYRAIQESFTRFPFFGFPRVVRKHTGKSMEEIFDEMLSRLEEEYRGLRAAMDDRPGTLLSPERRGDYYLPAVTNSGLILYRTRPDREPAIIHYDPETGTETVLTEARLTEGSAVSATPDGSRIAFSGAVTDRTHRAGSVSESRLFVLETERAGQSADIGAQNADGAGEVDGRPTGGRIRRIPDSDGLRQPAILPDGRGLVAIERIGPRYRLVHVEVASGERTVLFDPETGSVSSPAVSPDGSIVAFSYNEDGEQTIVIARLRGDDIRFGGGRGGDGTDSSGGANGADANGAGGDGPDSAADAGGGAGAPTPVDIRRVTEPDGSPDFYPRFADETSLLYSSATDRRFDTESLAIQLQDLTTDESQLLVSDPVGSYAAVSAADSIIYATYSSNGTALRRVKRDSMAAHEVAQDGGITGDTEDRRSAGVTQDPDDADGAGDAPPAQGLPHIASDRYFDFPYPQLWLPYPSITTRGSGQLDFGIGVTVIGSSLLGSSEWQAAAAYHPVIGQPLADLSISFSRGILGVDLSARRDYTGSAGGTAVRSSRQSVTFRLTPFDRSSLGRSHQVTVGTTLTHRLAVTAPADFSFDAAPPGARTGEDVVHALFARYARRPLAAPLQFYPPGSHTLRAGIRYLPPFPFNPEPFPLLQLGYDTYLPGLTPVHATRVRLETAYAIDDLPAARIVTPRSWNGLARPSEEAHGDAILQLGYKMPLALVDVPLFWGLHLAGFAASVYTELPFSFDVHVPALAPDNRLHLGAEFITVAGFKSLTYPLGAGVNVRLNPLAPVSTFEGVRFYFFLGLEGT